MSQECSILIERVIIVGTRKNYIIPFNPGVNIIYGDSSTGKSSILNLIDYLLGGKSFDLYPEIEAAALYAILEVSFNGIRYSIKRDIFDAKKMIEVYKCNFENIEQFSPTKYLPTYAKTPLAEEYDYYYDFLLDSLDLEKVQLKNSPSKSESKLSRLSFRDIFKYCYVDQDDLGSKGFLDRGDYILEAKHTEIFRFIFNALDTQISGLNAEISEKTNKKSKLEKKSKNISEFLRDADFNTKENIGDFLNKVEGDVSYLNEMIINTKNRHTADINMYKDIKSAVNELDHEVVLKELSILENQKKIENFSRLKNEYILDIKKFKSIQEMKDRIGEKKEEISLCPICDNHLSVEIARETFEISDSDNITYEINSLKRRSREVEKIIIHNRDEWESETSVLKSLKIQRDEARNTLDNVTTEMVSPYLSEVDTLISKKAALEQKRKSLVSEIKVRNLQSTITSDITDLENSIELLSVRLEKLKEQTPSISKIVEEMGGYLNSYLAKVNIKDRYSIGIRDKKYFPYVRDIDYQKLTSGGLRTITSIGYLCSFLRASLDIDMNYPTILMIDTVGKYLGKMKSDDKYQLETSKEDDNIEGVSDPEKYQNIYEYMIDLSETYEEKQRTCQFILVDNDVPRHIIEEYDGFVVAHYSSDPHDNLPVGLIDDAPSHVELKNIGVTLAHSEDDDSNDSPIQLTDETD